MGIQLFKEDVKIDLRSLTSTKKWLALVAHQHSKSIAGINYIFCSDRYLHRMNIEYLQHDTFTDIITFDSRENANAAIEADIYISIERVEENAINHNTAYQNELHRVMAHGLLHLIGFRDKTEKDKTEMRAAENQALKIK
ncbi:MAG: putative rRNA maturation factor [Marivirga sp.]|jgi:probable rRNA maturation factor